ncbi:unnamed protein product [Amoebophrya sp. A25]|nr:unnamed protein product [Amoebophrya sp. A25]|eukprot:GSA25T00014594001.1
MPCATKTFLLLCNSFLGPLSVYALKAGTGHRTRDHPESAPHPDGAPHRDGAPRRGQHQRRQARQQQQWVPSMANGQFVTPGAIGAGYSDAVGAYYDPWTQAAAYAASFVPLGGPHHTGWGDADAHDAGSAHDYVPLIFPDGSVAAVVHRGVFPLELRGSIASVKEYDEYNADSSGFAERAPPQQQQPLLRKAGKGKGDARGRGSGVSSSASDVAPENSITPWSARPGSAATRPTESTRKVSERSFGFGHPSQLAEIQNKYDQVAGQQISAEHGHHSCRTTSTKRRSQEEDEKEQEEADEVATMSRQTSLKSANSELSEVSTVIHDNLTKTGTDSSFPEGSSSGSSLPQRQGSNSRRWCDMDSDDEDDLALRFGLLRGGAAQQMAGSRDASSANASDSQVERHQTQVAARVFPHRPESTASSSAKLALTEQVIKMQHDEMQLDDAHASTIASGVQQEPSSQINVGFFKQNFAHLFERPTAEEQQQPQRPFHDGLHIPACATKEQARGRGNIWFEQSSNSRSSRVAAGFKIAQRVALTPAP